METHLITSDHALPLLIRRPGGLVVEMTDGTAEYNRDTYRVSSFYDLAKARCSGWPSPTAHELGPLGATAVALTPGWLRSEMMLENYGVHRGQLARSPGPTSPHFAISETPRYVGRAVAALAADPDVAPLERPSLSSGHLAQEYGFTDLDGSRPDAWRYMVEVQDPDKPADMAGYR